MESMMQEFQALGSQSQDATFGRTAGQNVGLGYEEDDDLFEAIRSASIVTGLDLEHPFPLSEQYFDSFPMLGHQSSSLADFSDDIFGSASLSKVPSIGQSLGDTSSSLLLGHTLASGFAGLAQFNQSPAISVRPSALDTNILASSQTGLYPASPPMQLPHTFARTHHASQYSAFLSGASQASAPFLGHSALHGSSYPTTDQLSTTSSNTPASSEYPSEPHMQLPPSSLSLGLGLGLGADATHPLEAGGDPNPTLIKESDLRVSDECARADREKTFGESLFPAVLWGRSVFVRKLNNSAAPGTNEPHSDGEKLRLDFLRELQVLTDFRHGNILPLQAFSFWPMILVYPLLPDRLTLLELLSDAALTRALHWSTRLRIVSTICSALAYVHHGCPELARPGIVHRYNNVPYRFDT